ncbi:hypothetical protein CVT25_015507 [Psilocybe cyanescens]|uniref:Mannosyltransferase n=1 Tax=Psilocybe cyanescens TaxID=93625 RepID=A0A409WI34_PSICY|nr:hypothetical protein CVT25_015507 [Psilocybe cyanescens]
MYESTCLAIAIRVIIALFTRTFFQPDEYFQSLEPAHNLVFGYGHLTWEWMAPQPIRSIVYPAINVPIYWLLKILLPKVLHGSLAACTDIYVGEIARRTLGADYVTTARFVSLASLFHAMALSRSLSNSLETSLSTIAFSYYPWDASSKLSPQVMFHRPRLRKMILFSALACIIRPTNAVIWTFLFFNLFWAIRKHRRIVLAIGKDVAFLGITSLVLLFTLDSLYYGNPTFTPFNFLKTNLSAVSLFYGANPWHFYLTQALPILCTTALPFTLHGIWSTLAARSSRDYSTKTIISTVAWAITVYSFAGHKEWRFIHPILPLLHVFAAKSLVDISFHSHRSKKDTSHLKAVVYRRFQLPNIPGRYLTFLLLTIPVSLYIILFYCSGPIEVMSYLRKLPKSELNNDTIGFLMPCHSTPGQSHLHRKDLAERRMWQLGCEPPLNHQDLSTYRDQTDVFFDSPHDYLLTYFPNKVNPTFPPSPFPSSIPGRPAPVPSFSQASNKLIYPWRHEWPRYVVLFGELLRQEGIRTLLENRGYSEVWKAGREWEGEGQRKGAVRVWKWRSP